MKSLFKADAIRGRRPFTCTWPGCTLPAAGTFTDTSSGEAFRVRVCRRHRKHIFAGGGAA